jgi:hypothetical protein
MIANAQTNMPDLEYARKVKGNAVVETWGAVFPAAPLPDWACHYCGCKNDTAVRSCPHCGGERRDPRPT